jgi:asparagine synthase (glutamine-hydrolysing)
VPVSAWFRGPQLGRALRAVLLSEQALARGWYQQAPLHRLIEDHAEGRADNGRRLWILFQLELWHRMFVEGTFSATDELPT